MNRDYGTYGNNGTYGKLLDSPSGAHMRQVQGGVLNCTNCLSKFSLEPLLYCRFCKQALEYLLPGGKANQADLRKSLLHFRFSEFLPVPDGGAITSLGEGNLGEGRTPLIHCERLQQKYRLNRLYLKNEGANPTGSWKDRAISLAVSCVRSFGYQTVSVYSCGNAGVSTAAYAARLGLESVIFVLPTMDRAKYNRILSYGGCVVPLQISRSDLWKSSRVGEVLEEAQAKLGWFPVTTLRNPYVGSPFYTEGFKTIAFELFLDLGATVPDWVFVPAGSGEGLCGIWTGFKNLFDLGLIRQLPRIVGVQAETAAPLVHAFRNSMDQVEFVESGKTIAAGLEVMNSSNQSLRTIKISHGSAESVNDSDIRQTMNEVRREEDVNASPEGAIGLAAIKKMRSEGRLKEDDLIVCISSASEPDYPGPKGRKEFPLSSVPLNLSEISGYVSRRSTPCK
jgi:threonine synthase